jgi:cysteine synthase
MTYPTLEAFVGNTPLVRLQRLPGNSSNTLLVKLEGNNPAGSVKDRPAISMIRHAEERRARVRRSGAIPKGASPRSPLGERWPLHFTCQRR